MNPTPPKGRRLLREWLPAIARVALGGLFVYMGLSKSLHPEAFLKLVRQYDVVTQPFWLNAIAASLPWFEVFCGLLLILGIAVRGTALISLGMLVPFTLVVLQRALLLASSQGIPFCAVKFDCGCGAGEVFICNKLAENSILILVSAWLLAGAGQRFCARFGLWGSPQAAGPGAAEGELPTA